MSIIKVQNSKIIEKPLWGWEDIIINDEMYCLKRLNLLEGHQFSLQYHKNKKESHYIEEGVVLMQKGMDGKALNNNDSLEYMVLEKRDIVTIPQLTAHRCGSLDGTSCIIEVSTHHKDSDTYKLEETIEGVTNLISREIMEKYTRQKILV